MRTGFGGAGLMNQAPTNVDSPVVHRGVQRGFAPLRFFIIPQDWGIKGVEYASSGDTADCLRVSNNAGWVGSSGLSARG